MKKISIIIPVYNVEQYITRCLTSVQNQTWSNLEILCIDDGSGDRSGVICDSFAAEDHRITVYHKSNGGAASARNMGLDHATGEYIGFVDGDDWIEPEMFEVLVRKAVSLNADMCASGFIKEVNGKTYSFVDDHIEQDIPFSGEQAINYAFQRYLYKSFANYNWSKLFKAELINSRGDLSLRYDTELKMCEDTLFFVEAAMRATRVTYVAQAFYHYDQRMDSLVHDSSIRDRYCNLIAYQRIIDIMEAACYSHETVKWAKRFYVYHASLILELAARKRDEENVLICQQAISKYLKEYEETSMGNVQWNQRMRRMLEEPYKVAEEAKIKQFDRLQEYYTEQLLLPVEDRTVLYEAFGGRGMICGSYGLFQAFKQREDFSRYRHIWVINTQSELIRLQNLYQEYTNVTFVLQGSLEYLERLARCRILINNTNFPFYFLKREEQTLLNTWHGIPMKHLGYDVPDGVYSMHNNFRNFLLADYILGWNPLMTEVYRNAYKLNGIFTGEIIEEGCPRNDLTLHTDKEKFLATLERAGIRIDRNKKIILFAPTWRGTNPAFPEFHSEEVRQFMQTISEGIDGDDYQILFRPHTAVYKYVEKEKILMDCSIPPYFDANEVLSVTDVLISDYSSIYFDFLLTGKPVIFYINDLGSYGDYRGLYFGLERLPGPIVKSGLEVAEQIGQLQDFQKYYGEKYEAMCQWACGKDDGQVSRRILEILLDGNRQGKLLYSDFIDNRKKVLVLYDKMEANDKTSELLARLQDVDETYYDVTLIVREPKTDEERQQMRNIPSHIRTLARVNTWNVTAQERKIMEAVPHKNNDENLDRIYSREYRRCVGSTRFDYCVNGDDESLFTRLFCRYVKGANPIVFTDLIKAYRSK